MLESTEKKNILHPFLFSIFLVIFIYSHNIFVIPIQEIIFPLLSILGITLVSFIVLARGLKNSRKSGLIVTLYLLLFFSFGHIFNIVNDFSIGEFDIGRYSYLLILYFIIFVIGTIYLLRTKIELNGATKIINVVAITLLAVILVSTVTTSMNEYTLTNENILQDTNLHDTQDILQLQILNKKLPNVYYIILDEYGNQNSLQQFFNYDNSNFVSFLKEKEFFVVENSYANYPSTKLSLGSSMNMKYLNYLTNSLGIESKNQHVLDQMVSDNFVMQNFQSNGYEIINMGSLWGPNNEFKIADQNLCENKEMNRDSLMREIIETSMAGYLLERIVEDERREVILCTFEKISEIKHEKPVFVFAHILLPHSPFIFGPNGEKIIPGTSLDSKPWNPRDAFIDQVKFANKKTQESIEKILQNEGENAIIILQSDTGSAFELDWDNPTREMIVERMSNLNAYYLPDKNYELFYDKLTPVNSFRLIFNSYFNQNYEIMNDQMYWSSSNQPYNFKDVTNILVNNNNLQPTLILDNEDTFGNEIGLMGDFDNDGVNDIVVAASGDDDGGQDRGAVYILFLNQDGTLKEHQKISDTKGNFEGVLDDGDEFGISSQIIDDLDGDGINELAVGSFEDDDGGQDRGAVYILFLNQDGTVKEHQKISDTEGSFEGVLDDGDTFGRSLIGLGDLDGDGINELAVGVHHDDDGGQDRGAVYILFLNQDGTVKEHQKISDTKGNFEGVLDDGDEFGSAIDSIEDFDKDGINDIMVGATEDDDGGQDRGAVYILFLNQDGTVKEHQKISDTKGNFEGVLDDGDTFGRDVSIMKDLNGDGINELAVGAYKDDDGGQDRGAVYILFLNQDGTVKEHQKISDTKGNFDGEIEFRDYFGRDVDDIGDLDGDGINELAVGAFRNDNGGKDRGTIYILFLNQDGTVKEYQKIPNLIS